MRIAINTRLLLKGKMDGIGWFTAETTRRMIQSHPEHTFYLFFDRKPAEEFLYGPNEVPVVLCPQARHPLLWYMFFEWAIPWALKHYNIELFLSPDGMIPLHPTIPTLTVIHDLNFEHADDNLRSSHQRYMTHFFPHFARNATRVATVSEYSKRDICDTYGVGTDKVDVVYDGANPCYRPHTDSEKASVRQRFTHGAPFLIFVSTILKRKNLANLLLDFDKVKEHTADDLKLVVVGSRAWWQDELSAAYNNMLHKDDILMLGHVNHNDLAALMSASQALVYPSFFEGFGIPILEAMYAETAVVASMTTSMPEVGGDAVLYIDPSSPESIADAIINVLDPLTRETLIDKGRSQRTLYSWDRSADLLWQSIIKTYGRP